MDGTGLGQIHCCECREEKSGGRSCQPPANPDRYFCARRTAGFLTMAPPPLWRPGCDNAGVPQHSIIRLLSGRPCRGIAMRPRSLWGQGWRKGGDHFFDTRNIVENITNSIMMEADASPPPVVISAAAPAGRSRAAFIDGFFQTCGRPTRGPETGSHRVYPEVM